VVIRQAFGITFIEVQWTDDLTLHTKVAEGEIQEASLFVVSESFVVVVNNMLLLSDIEL
jgi:hypothetical protein